MGFWDSFEATGEAAADLVTELTSFTTFRRQVDELIRDLKRSPADARRVGQQELSRHQFGGGDAGWSDASGVFTSYQAVIKELEGLSRLLHDSMEGMSIAVLASHKGYQNIDLDVRHRMAHIYAETAKHYGDRRHGQPYGTDPYAKHDGKSGSPRDSGGGQDTGQTPGSDGGDAGGVI